MAQSPVELYYAVLPSVPQCWSADTGFCGGRVTLRLTRDVAIITPAVPAAVRPTSEKSQDLLVWQVLVLVVLGGKTV